jgi:hypothetical protein
VSQLSIRDAIDAEVYLVLLGEPIELSSRLASRCDFVTKDAAGIASAYRISHFPTAVAIDRAGRIAGYNHPQEYRDLQRLLRIALVDGDEASGRRVRRLPEASA